MGHGALRSLILIVVLFFLVSQARAFDLRQVDIRIQSSGDAVITLNYTGNAAEYLGIKTLAATPGSVLNTVLSPAFSGPGGEASVEVGCAGTDTAQLTIAGFAYRNGDTYVVPEISLAEAAYAALPPEVVYSVDVTTDAMIVFPDGYVVRQQDTTTIGGVSHRVVSGQAFEAPAPPAGCTKEKDLPLSAVIPDEVAPVAAVGVGMVATAAGMSIFGSTLSVWFSRVISFIEEAVGEILQEWLMDKEKEKRVIKGTGDSFSILGLSKQDMSAIAVGAAIIGVFFLFADRIPLTLDVLAVYIVMGGFALTAHEVAHWYFNKRFYSTTEIQIWGSGTLIMALTAWLFGSVFAQPVLTLVYSDRVPDKRSLGLIMLSGPLVSFVVALGCLCLIPYGGVLALAGSVGFSINLLMSVFEMLPIPPCDGWYVFSWSRHVWAAVFIPLILLYLVVIL